MNIRSLSAVALSLFLAACAAPVPREPNKGHLTTDNLRPAPSADIPAPVQQTMALPKPRAAAKAETYSVVVNNVTVKELLFALARDARLNVDIHPGISGYVTLNAIDQTLPQLLSRIAKQVDMRFELDGPNLAVMPDSPFLKHYKVDYVNMSRNVTGTVSTNTQIATTSSAAGAASAGGTAGNISNTRIENASKNQFWESLEKNIKDILHDTDKILWEKNCSDEQVGQRSSNASNNATTSGIGAIANAMGLASAGSGNQVVSGQGAQNQESRQTNQRACGTFKEAASVIMSAESGVITVRATGRQHEKIQEFVDRVVNASRRQVMIEATIVEVQLGNGYEQGIDWTRLIGAGKFSLISAAVNTSISPSISPFKMTYDGQTVNTAIRLLQSFGTAKVLSSPRLSVMNNQTALLKVVENIVYFNVKADTTTTANVGTTTAVTTTPQSVSVGLVMTVTPQVSENDAVILNVRPTISSISAFKRDPNPSIPANIENLVPQIRTREIESVMRIASGDIAVLGGLMEDGVDYKTGRIPGISQLPIVGELATARSNSTSKSELVIFLRPVVIKDASLTGDYGGLRDLLPDPEFFTTPPQAQPFNLAPAR